VNGDLLQIYNSYVRAYRVANNAPYQPRKNYETLPQKVKNKVERIKIFFDAYDLNKDDFFDAPYFIFRDTKYFPFEYYLSRKAIKSYSDFQKELLMRGPDEPKNLLKIKNTVQFLKKFCKNENIKFKDYLNHNREKIPSFITHLKERKVSIYFLLGLDNFTSAFYSFNSNLSKFMIPDIYDNFELYQKNFNTSKYARVFVKTILNKNIIG
jgi:hypothetical protein